VRTNEDLKNWVLVIEEIEDGDVRMEEVGLVFTCTLRQVESLVSTNSRHSQFEQAFKCELEVSRGMMNKVKDMVLRDFPVIEISQPDDSKPKGVVKYLSFNEPDRSKFDIKRKQLKAKYDHDVGQNRSYSYVWDGSNHVQNANTIECKANRLHYRDTVAVVARVTAYRIDETERIEFGHGLQLVEVWFLEKELDGDKKLAQT